MNLETSPILSSGIVVKQSSVTGIQQSRLAAFEKVDEVSQDFFLCWRDVLPVRSAIDVHAIGRSLFRDIVTVDPECRDDIFERAVSTV